MVWCDIYMEKGGKAPQVKASYLMLIFCASKIMDFLYLIDHKVQLCSSISMYSTSWLLNF
jgi:hypothetical protein